MPSATATGIRDTANRLFALFALFLASCGADKVPLDKLYAEGYREFESGNLSAAKALAEDGLRQAQETHQQGWTWAFEVLDAEVLVGQRQITAALGRLDAGLSADRPRDVVLARALMTRGYARCHTPDGENAPARAQADLETAERIAEDLGNSRVVAEVTLRRGTCAALQADLATAEALFRKTMETAERQGFRLIEAKAAGNLGNLRINASEYDDAVRWLRRSETLASGLAAGGLRARNLGRLGWCYYRLGDYERAIQVLSEAETLTQKLGYEGDRMVVLENLGQTLQRQGDYARANRSYARAATIAQELEDQNEAAETLADIQTTRAALALERGNYDEAASRAEEALRIQIEHRFFAGQRPTTLLLGEIRERTLLLLGEIRERRGELPQAAARYHEVIALPNVKPDMVWEAHAALARLYARDHRPAEAESEYRKAFALMETSLARLLEVEHQLPFFSSLDRFYDDYVDFLVGQGRTAEALRVADESRARLLHVRLQGTGSVPGHQIDYPRLARDSKALLLFYSTAADRSFLWAVSADGIRLIPLPGEKTLSALVSSYQQRILNSRDPLAEAAPEGAELYRLLVQPVATAMASAERVILVSDGPLNPLNFETLIVPGSRSHYLIEDATLARTPSLRLLQVENASPPARARSLLVFGDPVPPDPEFPVLPFAGKEVASIAELFEPANRLVYSGQQATPSAYRNSDPKRFAYLHLAAHAQANSVVPLDSAVVLSADANAYKLYARDVVAVPLHAELVTLSTCRSAGTRTFSGEGLVGLSWAFLSAGSKRVVGGLWPVEDASTAELMTHLYRQLAAGADPIAALRQAKLDLLHSGTAYRKPYYWAPFVIYTSRLAGHARASATV